MSTARPVIIAGNWKMNTTPLDAALLANDIAAVTDVASVVRVVCPPVVCLESVARALADTDIEVGVQNIHAQPFGAYTGEVSAPMVTMFATWAIIGHSERRRDQGETDELIGRKLLRCAEYGLRPILCVGEQLDDREAGRAEETVCGQVEATFRVIEGAAANVPDDLVIAYEPIWAIGTGRSARGTDAAAMAQAIRRALTERGLPNAAAHVPILYGGSVTSASIGEFLDEPDIDGALVGGASLKVDEMAGIVARAGLTADARATAEARATAGQGAA
jgi:triosephosphate isomerase